MRSRLRRASALAALLLLGRSAPAGAAAPEIRVGIFLKAESLSLGPGEYSVRNPAVRSSRRYSSRTNTLIAPSPTGILVDGKSLGKRVALESIDSRGLVVIDGRRYRGRVEVIWKSSKALTAVNVLPVEDYVRGILAREASPEWPLEALKAQAVVSRTYALRNRGRHGSDGYDLCSATHCQVFGGQSAEREETDRAVEATRGRVALYKGRLISTVFHSCCGGSTESAGEVWEGAGAPYLKAVRCPWCRGSPRYEWAQDVDGDALARRLAAAGHDVGEVVAIKALSRSRSGRAARLRVAGRSGKAEMSGTKFRSIAGNDLVRSTLWRAHGRKGGAWSFRGRGWGHGAGMCQWGAKAMADRGKSHAQILRFYYRGISLGKVKA